MADSQQKDFHIGLAMSGAVSAGAYAAGVLDFLIEALDEWERMRGAPGGDTVPSHRVGLKAMSGASAGAITAGIGAVALADADGTPGDYVKDGFSYHYCLPRLYDAWVVKPTLVAESDQAPDFLSLTDLDGRPKPEDDFSRTSGIQPPGQGDPIVVTSLLNAQMLDAIAKAAIDVKRVRPPRAYVSQTLHVYITLTNLRGVPYEIPFDGGPYHMISHGDRVHYALNGLGSWPATSAFGTLDKKRELDAAWLATGDEGQKARWKDYSICAVASGAFPVGLAPRLIGGTLGDDTLGNEYDGRLFPIEDIVSNTKISPSFGQSVLSEKPFWFTCADGGIIDNDPFEYARFSLKDDQKFDQPIVSKLDEVDRAVIMISAFPEEKPIRQEGEPHTDIVSLFSALMPALINQARFKPDELALAADATHGSRYLIGPQRTIGDKRQRYALASGLLGGFGGFVARTFRDHDFQLGRRNCQWFLRTSFGLPDANPVVRSWAARVDRKRVEMVRTGNRPAHYGLVPLLGSAAPEVELPPWPRISQAEFDKLQARIAQRFDRVAPLFIQQNVGGVLGFLLGLVLMPLFRDIPGLIRGRALKFVRLTILADLVCRDQIEGWELPADLALGPDDVRLVLGELLNPNYDQRNVAGIVKALRAAAASDADPAKVEAALQDLKRADGKPYQVWEAPRTDKNGGKLYTLVSRKPGVVNGVLGGRVGLDFFKPKVDPPGR
jgi:Patatin-like phospholipase